jgi:WD40 repeat protein
MLDRAQVDVLFLHSATKRILSGGSDGYVRIWDFNKVRFIVKRWMLYQAALLGPWYA